MKTRTKTCGLVAVMLLGAVTLLGNAQERSSSLETVRRPISSRSKRTPAARRSTPVRKQIVSRKVDNSHRVHRFDELFDSQDSRQNSPTEQVASGSLHEPARLPTITETAEKRFFDHAKVAQVSAQSDVQNPFHDDPEINGDQWRLDEVEPMVMDPATGQYVQGAPQSEPTRSGSSPVQSVVQANAVPMSGGVQRVQGERGWRSGGVSTPQDNRAEWVYSDAGRTATNSSARPLKRGSLRRGLRRPGSFSAGTTQRSTPRPTASHWASEGNVFPGEAVRDTPARLMPVPTRTGSRSATTTNSGGIDNSWYDDSPQSFQAVPAPSRPQIPTRTLSMRSPVSTRQVASDNTRLHTQPEPAIAMPVRSTREVPLEPHPNVSDTRPMTRSERMMAIRRRSGLTGFKGFCPVALCDARQLSDSRPEFFTNYRNRTYYFSSPEAKSRFDANPVRYAPAAQGKDVVRLIESNEHLAGRLDFCCWHEQVLYMFSTAESLARFEAQPWKYVTRY